jgi:hypothetical protein
MSAADPPRLRDLHEVKIDPAWALRVPASLAVRRQMLAFALIDGQVRVACASDHDTAAIQALSHHLQ